jgi:hypothetical protein
MGAAILLAASALGLSACATGFPAKVSRYQAMPNPQGQSFVVVPYDSHDVGGLEFARYAELVAQAMQAQGYARAPSIDQATMVVQVGYGVDDGQVEYQSDPFYYHSPYWGGFGGPYYSRFGYRGFHSPFYYGWSDPFWYAPYGGGISSYTYYKSKLNVDIRRKADNISLFEGRAQARSGTDDLGVLVPNLIEAMFTGFPGHSGENVKITVPPERKVKS